MNPDSVFSIANTLVLPGWLLLAIAPRWKWTTRLITPIVIPVLLGVLYGIYLIPNLGGSEGGFGSLAGVLILFSQPELALAGWIHYLAFDMLVGTWMTRNAISLGITHWWVIPCLILTFMAGPIGYLLYLGVRGASTRRLLMNDLPEAV